MPTPQQILLRKIAEPRLNSLNNGDYYVRVTQNLIVLNFLNDFFGDEHSFNLTLNFLQHHHEYSTVVSSSRQAVRVHRCFLFTLHGRDLLMRAFEYSTFERVLFTVRITGDYFKFTDFAGFILQYF